MAAPDQSFFVNSNGQSGTHLAIRCLNLLGLEQLPISTVEQIGYVPFGIAAPALEEYDPKKHVLTGVNWPGIIDKRQLRDALFRPHLKPGGFGASHMFCNEAAVDMLRELGMKMILITREPKDWAWSSARKAMEFKHWEYGRPPEWTVDQHLHDFVFGFQQPTTMGRIGMVYRYAWMHEWSRHSELCLTVRFEDLVGPQGGGDANAQRGAVEKIADFVGAQLQGAGDPFGGTVTFRKGKIGTWREREEFFSRPDVAGLCRRASDIGSYSETLSLAG